MQYKLKCPKCGCEHFLGVELTNARIDYHIRIDSYTGELDYHDEEMIEADETFYCNECHYISKNPNDFIIREE